MASSPLKNPLTERLESRKISYQAASEICSVAQKYRKTFGSFRQSPVTATHCTLSAVLTLLNAAHHSWEGISMTVNNRNIELGLTVLEELSVCWNMAKRIRQNLQKLYQPLRPGIDRAQNIHSLYVPPIFDAGMNNTEEKASTEPLPADRAPPTSEKEWPLYSPDNAGQLLNAFMDWPFNDVLAQESVSSESEFFDALHNFSYMETNPIYQFDSLPDDYSSFDILNRIQVHNI